MTRSETDRELEAVYAASVRESTPSDALYARTRARLRAAGVLRHPRAARYPWRLGIAAVLAGVLIGRWTVDPRPGPGPTSPDSDESSSLEIIAAIQRNGTAYAEALDRLATSRMETSLAELGRAQETALAVGRAIRVAESRLGMDRHPTVSMEVATSVQPEVWF